MNDTREQLERSIDRFLGSWTGWSVSIKVLREAIIGWLDRQAAITEREYMGRIAELQAKLDKGNNGECYLVYEGEKYPVELDFGFLGMMPITITVGGFRYLVEVPNGE